MTISRVKHAEIAASPELVSLNPKHTSAIVDSMFDLQNGAHSLDFIRVRKAVCILAAIALIAVGIIFITALHTATGGAMLIGFGLLVALLAFREHRDTERQGDVLKSAAAFRLNNLVDRISRKEKDIKPIVYHNKPLFNFGGGLTQEQIDALIAARTSAI